MTPDHDAPGAAGVPARYFDGQTSRLYHVTLSVRDGQAVLAGDIERSCPLGELHVSERSRHAVRKISFADGAYLEIADQAAFNDMLHDTGHRDGWVVRLQQSWRGALLATVATVVALWLSYQYLLPLAAKGIAYALPQSVERQLGQGVLDMLDRHVFAPSQLDGARQQALRARFARLATPGESAPVHRIVFRKSKIGPNAFALPSGDIVLTDEMVELMPDDDAIMGVLAHELGHLQQRHLTRRLIQTSAVGAGAALLFGDVSTVVATLPPLLLDLKYSRDVEREADDYAIAMLRQNGIALEHLAQVFVALGKLDEGTPYLSSHPASAERVARIRAAQR
ncbi:M48 family metallopeptidase [Janthinobacterium sp. JC611]|uniref:M48 family metallopeptidase n=1 Tax=Janthinobacterium sp. JC611 TaxID=2816201 RepID=UPI001BFDA571|nr:M48 family metallopeptidase [Janthinobacterium sp. JC611]